MCLLFADGKTKLLDKDLQRSHSPSPIYTQDPHRKAAYRLDWEQNQQTLVWIFFSQEQSSVKAQILTL